MNKLDDKWLPLLHEVIAQHKLDIEKSGHGLHHWLRVIDIGMRLADADPRVDRDVIVAFGLLHDSARTHDNYCEEHGPNSLNVIRALDSCIPLDDNQKLMLSFACVNHTSADCNHFPLFEPTLHACFDADRLDLWRVGIVPDSKYLFTDAGKDPELQAWANSNGENWTIPVWAHDLI